jgi:DNA ligase (NAD+)
VGETVAKKLARHFGNMDALMHATRDDLLNVEEVGEKIAESVFHYFRNPAGTRIIERLREAGLQMECEKDAGDGSEKILGGKSIVVSGVFRNFSRDELKDLIEKSGGKNAGSISSKTSFLLAGEESGPAKAEKAKLLKIPVLSEDEFIKMIGYESRS